MFLSHYLPPGELTNEELALRWPDDAAWTAEQILRKTGVRVRHIADGMLPSDMAVAAAERLFAEHGISPEDVDFILLCSQSSDYPMPSTCCLIQDRLGVPKTSGALRIDYGCSGYIYGLLAAKGLLATSEASRLLFINAEIHTRMVHPKDRSNLVLLGDASTATFLTADDLPRIGRFVVGTDGSGAENLIVRAGGAAMPRGPETAIDTVDEWGNVTSPEHVYMNGMEIFSFSRLVVIKLVSDVLAKNGLDADDIDIYLFHQPNVYMLTMLRDKIKIPPEKFIIDMEETGNSASCSIPLALSRAMKRDPERFRPGTRILLAGFGIGYSWGATVITM